MPIAVALTGTPSVSKRWRANIVVTGLSSIDDLAPLHVHIGSRATAGEPEAPEDLALGFETKPLGRVQYNTVKSLTRDAAGEGRLGISQTLDPGDLPGFAVGGYVWAGVSETDDPAEPFVAVAGPLRVRA